MVAQLRLADLGKRTKSPKTRLMNLQIPLGLSEDIGNTAKAIGCTKTELVIALLNEGLEVAATKLRDVERPKPVKVAVADQCSRSGCKKKKVAKGLCPSHYQASRRAKL